MPAKAAQKPRQCRFGTSMQEGLRDVTERAGASPIAVDGIARGFGPREKTLLVALWSMPLAARNVAPVSLVPLGVPRHPRCICPDIAAQRSFYNSDGVLHRFS
jgi:hypothetical protein